MALQSFVIDPGGNVILKVVADDGVLSTGDGKGRWVVPASLDGRDMVIAGAHVYGAASSGVTTIQLHNERDSADMLSTRITIDATEYDSKDANIAPVVDTANDDVLEGDVIRMDVDSVGVGVEGLEVRMGFR